MAHRFKIVLDIYLKSFGCKVNKEKTKYMVGIVQLLSLAV